ncbi:MAG: chemotaxis protein CheX [Planctomycetota bacterium]
MDPSYISPFVTSTQNVFSTMLQLPVDIGEPAMKDAKTPSHDVSGIIGMSGDVVGSIVLSFPKETAERVVALFVGEHVDADSPDFADAIGELVNMVSGGAKAQFPDEKRVSISVPSVVIGSNHTVSSRSDAPCVLIPCNTDCGELTIEIAIAHAPGAGAAAA